MTLPARSFPPLEGPQARLLILGSMPGMASLEAARYYAHPRNAFWPIVMALLDAGGAPAAPSTVDEVSAPGRRGIDVRLPGYDERVRRLLAAGIALWDVLAECVRPGSLDAAIRRDSERANELPALCDRHPELSLIAFNGQTAAKLFERHVGEEVRARRPDIRCLTLPSTSPAHASLTLADKHARWRDALGSVIDSR